MGRGSVKRFLSKQTEGARTFKLVPGAADTRTFVEITPGSKPREHASLEAAFQNGHEYIDVEAGSDSDFSAKDKSGAVGVGEAAKYGVLFDDRSYDYTKHLRTVGDTPGGVFVKSLTEPVIDELAYREQLKKTDEESFRKLKEACAADEAVLEVLCALEDEAFEGMIPDDLVLELDQEFEECGFINVEDSAGEELDDILEEYDEWSEEEDVFPSGLCESDVKQLEVIKLTTLELEAERKRKGYESVDLLRRLLLPDGRLRLPQSSSSELDSDELYEEASSDDDINSVSRAPLSSTINRPKVLAEIKLSGKTGLPVRPKLVKDDLIDVVGEEQIKDNLGERRVKEETAEDKKARKDAIKVQRKDRRAEKKEKKLSFK